MKKETKLWLDHAKEDLKNLEVMWTAHRYGPTAFYCQQAVEKIIKAIIVEKKNQAPRKSHDLLRLLEDSGLLDDFPKEWVPELKEMSRHYFRVRYPGLSKKFYSRREAVKKMLTIAKEIYSWFLKKLKK